MGFTVGGIVGEGVSFTFTITIGIITAIKTTKIAIKPKQNKIVFLKLVWFFNSSRTMFKWCSYIAKASVDIFF